MQIEKITCDGCGADISVRTNSVDYRLLLISEEKPGYGAGFYTDMFIEPPVVRSHHFCRLMCLDRWRDREKCKAASLRSWWDRWITEHGTKTADGAFSSYPVPPDDVVAVASEAANSIALKAFPLGPTTPPSSAT